MTRDIKRKDSLESDKVRILNFFEELSWLLDSNKSLDFKKATTIIKEFRSNSIYPYGYFDNHLEKRFIGVLPSLLKDNEIFNTNEELVDFALNVLSLKLTRWQKKSRAEIIGLIICDVEDANIERLDTLAAWFDEILKNRDEVKILRSKARETGSSFSWNDTIRKITGLDYER